jgi:hypothetical protein
MKKLGRWAKEHLTIQRRSPSQSVSRAPSAASGPSGTVHPQGIFTNHCPWIRINPLVKSCHCLNVYPSHLVSHRHNVAVRLSYDRLASGHSSRSADPNPRNEVSSALDGTDQDSKCDRLELGHSPCSADPNPRSDASSGLDGKDRDTKDEEKNLG